LRDHLRAELPAYMVPSAFVKLEVMPLTPNGKVDRKALPAPDAEALVTHMYEAPQGPVEEVLAGIWQELLGVERVGRNDSFFDLGGHSLLAVQLMGRMRRDLGQEIELRELFDAPTLAAVASRLQQADEALTAPIEPAERTKDLVLSWAQQRLWFLEQLEDLGSAYHIPAVLRLQGELDRGALQRTLDAILARHEALRTVFVRADDGEPVQRILPMQPFALAYRDLSQLAEGEREQAKQALTEETLHRPFDLTQDVLIRASLVKLAEKEYILNLCMHHIVSDGWSMGVLTRELAALYEALSQGQENPLPALPIQYADYAQWQRQWLSGERLEQQVAFWKEELSGAPSLLELPTDRPRPQVQSFAGSVIPFELGEGLTQGLNALARRHGATLFMVLQAGFAVLLGRLSGQDNVVVGTPVANRKRSELEGLIGFFVNTLALRTRLDGQATVSELLAQVRDRTLAGFGHQDVPFEQVVEAVQPERDMSHSPLFQVMLVLQNNAEVELKLPGLTLGQEEFGHDTTHFDLTLSLGEEEGRLQGMVEYGTALFERETVERWLGHLKVLLSAMVADEACTLAQLPLLTEEEREQVIREFNATDAEYPKEALIHELFEQQVERTPQAVAVRYEDEQLTYVQLNARANQLAHRLRAMRDASGAPVMKPDALVAISVERSLEMVVGLLGILKAGAAYVPMDPEYPADRIAYMLGDEVA
ncbi:condensation domain-containing protein, partial [Lautropia dentalis]